MLAPYKTVTRHNTLNNSSNGLFIVRHNTNYVKKSFFNDSAVMWNSIPADIRLTVNNATFKERLYLYLLNETPE